MSDTRAQSLDYLDAYLREIAGIRSELLGLIKDLHQMIDKQHLRQWIVCPTCGQRDADNG